MPVPLETQKRISEAVAQVRQTPDHQLAAVTRFAIYQSFGDSAAQRVLSNDGYYLPASYSEADRVFNWLSVLTARKVLPAWEEFGCPDYVDNTIILKPQFWLESAEAVLMGDLAFNELASLTYNEFAQGLEGLEDSFTEPVYLSLYTSFQPLQILLMEFNEQANSRFTNPQNDLAANAVKAFAGLDQNEAGLWVVALGDAVEGYVPLSYEPGKTLEFWEWWLQQAIPQAWELASLHK